MELLCPILGRVTRVRPTAFRSGEWQVVRCEETGFVFLANPPSYEALTSEHAWEVTSAAEKERRKSAEPLLSKLLMKSGSPASGLGRLLLLAGVVTISRV